MGYATAHMLTASMVDTNSYSGLFEWVPPAALIASGVPANCAISSQISGFVGGRLFAPYDEDQSRLDDEGSVVYGLPRMETAFNPAVTVNPELACPGAETTVIASGAVVMPVGAGRGQVTDHGPIVPYDHVMDADLTTLVMISRGVPSITYIWTR